MKTFPLTNQEGQVVAFEVRNLLLGREGAARVVSRITGARLIRGPQLFSWFAEEEFCEFEVDGQPFVIWEPFGDNSRYWIGPTSRKWCPQLEAVRRAFQKARPFVL